MATTPTVVIKGEGQSVRLVSSMTVLRFVYKGPRGEKGAKGDPGVDRSQRRYYGEGPPTLIIGQQLGDEYVDALTGTLYVLT